MAIRDFRKWVVRVFEGMGKGVDRLSWKSLFLFTTTFLVLAALDNDTAEGVEVGLGFVGLALLIFGKGIPWLNDRF